MTGQGFRTLARFLRNSLSSFKLSDMKDYIK
jgi:hypothetical protein